MSPICRSSRRSTRNGAKVKSEQLNATATNYRTVNKTDINSSDSDSDENIENVSDNRMMKTTKSLKPATKRKSKQTSTVKPTKPTQPASSSDDSDEELEHSPPKQTKTINRNISEYNPIVLLQRLTLTSPAKNIKSTNEPKTVLSRTKYQNARRTLNNSETYSLPGRDKELNELSAFLSDGLNEQKSSSLYVSGPPGTGKTACLSKLLNASEFTDKFKRVYINCTSISSIGSIYKKVCAELSIKTGTEKECLAAIENYLTKKHKPVLMVLDEIDVLVGKKQSVLYTIFEWPALNRSNMLLIGIANSLDLTDRFLSRLHAKCELKPRLMHFAPYSKQQIIDIFKSRLEEAEVLDIFPAVTIQMLAAKVAAVSGDVRRALDIGRRVIGMAEDQKRGIKQFDISDLRLNVVNANAPANEKVEIKQVVQVLNQVYGAAQTLAADLEDTFPLQQKIMICTVLLILKQDKNKDITIGRLHGVYAKVCAARHIQTLDQSEFVGLCELVEIRGILRVIKNKEPRLCKIQLQWDEGEVTAALQDKQLIASILADTTCIKK